MIAAGFFCKMALNSSTDCCGTDWSSYTTNLTGRPLIPPLRLMKLSNTGTIWPSTAPTGDDGPVSERIIGISNGGSAARVAEDVASIPIASANATNQPRFIRSTPQRQMAVTAALMTSCAGKPRSSTLYLAIASISV